MNLLAETVAMLKDNGKHPSDVLWVGVLERFIDRQPGISFAWAEFAALADFEYDAGFGGANINGSLRIVGADWWLERGEYDGSEWWEFKALPVQPAPAAPCKKDLL